MLSFLYCFISITVQFLLFRMTLKQHTANKTFSDSEFFPLTICACSGGTWWQEEASRSFYLCACSCL